MKKKTLNLIIAIIATVIFIGLFSKSGSIEFLGIQVNIWIYRIIWLFIAFTYFVNYIRLKKEENPE